MHPLAGLPAALREFLDIVLAHAVKPQAALLAPIGMSGAVAVVPFEPTAPSRRALLRLGWDGNAPVFSLDDTRRVGLAEAWKNAGDEVGCRWLSAHHPDDGAYRILVFARDKPLLLNYRKGSGYSLEPKSLSLMLPAGPDD